MWIFIWHEKQAKKYNKCVYEKVPKKVKEIDKSLSMLSYVQNDGHKWTPPTLIIQLYIHLFTMDNRVISH